MFHDIFVSQIVGKFPVLEKFRNLQP